MSKNDYSHDSGNYRYYRNDRGVRGPVHWRCDLHDYIQRSYRMRRYHLVYHLDAHPEKEEKTVKI